MSKTILITGASSGFGRVIAQALGHAGHKVFASMRDPNEHDIYTELRDLVTQRHLPSIRCSPA
jgi:NAD(P)-dependent dehydrogenase (short-subunit alcohol dehydrogenase family)